MKTRRGLATLLTGALFVTGCGTPATLLVGTPAQSQGNLIFTADKGSNQISVFRDASNGALAALTPIALGTAPLGLVEETTSNGETLFVTTAAGVLAFAVNNGAGTVTPLTATPVAPESGNTLTGPVAVDPSGTALFVATTGTTGGVAFSAIDGYTVATSGVPTAATAGTQFSKGTFNSLATTTVGGNEVLVAGGLLDQSAANIPFVTGQPCGTLGVVCNGTVCATPIQIAPDASGAAVGGCTGFNVAFRKANPCGTCGPLIENANDQLSGADTLFNLGLTDPELLSLATDNGVSKINYVDTGGTLFCCPRDVATCNPGPLTAVKGTFLGPLQEDDDFAMRAVAFVLFPSAGTFSLFVGSDDNSSLVMGSCNTQVTLFNCGGRGYPCSLDHRNVTIPSAGFYRLQFYWDQGGGGAAASISAALTACAAQTTSFLLGCNTNLPIRVFQDVQIPALQAFTITAATATLATAQQLNTNGAVHAVALTGNVGVTAESQFNGANAESFTVDQNGNLANLHSTAAGTGTPNGVAVSATTVAGVPFAVVSTDGTSNNVSLFAITNSQIGAAPLVSGSTAATAATESLFLDTSGVTPLLFVTNADTANAATPNNVTPFSLNVTGQTVVAAPPAQAGSNPVAIQ